MLMKAEVAVILSWHLPIQDSLETEWVSYYLSRNATGGEVKARRADRK